MKTLCLLLICGVLSACSSVKLSTEKKDTDSTRQVVSSKLAPANSQPEIVAGVSSVTVENMAKKLGCRGAQGAARVSPSGPVEVYRIQCENGQVFQARCELRQCKQI